MTEPGPSAQLPDPSPYQPPPQSPPPQSALPQSHVPQPHPVGSGGPGFAPAQWLHLVTFVLGLAALFLGFAPAITIEFDAGDLFAYDYDMMQVDESASFYEGGVGALSPALLFAAGLAALLAVLPGGSSRPGPLVPALIIGVTLHMLFAIVVQDDTLGVGVGSIILLVLCVLQSSVAVCAYILDARTCRQQQIQAQQGTG